jgi:hypothetical protein
LSTNTTSRVDALVPGLDERGQGAGWVRGVVGAKVAVVVVVAGEAAALAARRSLSLATC